MIYILGFILCLLVDKSKTKFTKYFFVICIFVIFCFGYTTGSDWISYEVYYLEPSQQGHFQEREPGFTTLVYLSKIFINDFWVFNGLCKIFYVCSLITFFGFFTKRKWTAFAFSLLFSSLFMIVNCPMRFMIASGILFWAYVFFISGKRYLGIIVGIISITFHVTMIIPILFILSGVIKDRFYSLNKFILCFVTFLALILSSFSIIYSFIFSKILNLIGLGAFSQGSYAFFNSSGLFSLGTVRNLAICIFIIYFKDIFKNIRWGKLIFFYAVTSFWLGFILNPIPTGFRLVIFNSQMVCVGLTMILYSMNQKIKYYGKILRSTIYLLFGVFIFKQVYNSYIYYPYTNSIPYIITGHLNYNDRVNYNKKIYSKEIGPVNEDKDKGEVITNVDGNN